MSNDLHPGAENSIKQINNKAVLISTMITAFCTAFMGSSLNLSVPSLEQYFSVNAVTITWVVSVYSITIAALSLPFGKIADATGRRRVYLIGIVGFMLSSIAAIFARNIWMFIAFRGCQAACAAMLFATNMAILISVFPPNKRGKVIGYSTAGVYTGLTAGPVVGGILNSTFGWKAIFLAAASVSLLALLTGARYVPHDSKKRFANAGDGSGSALFDYRGTVIYMIAIALSLYGLTNFMSSSLSKVIFAAGVILIALFFILEAKTEDPIIKVTMFTHSRTFTFSSLAALLNYSAIFAISYLMSIYLQVVKGLPSSKAGLLLIMMPAVQAILSPVMGSLSDRIRASVLASLGMGFCAVSLLLFSRVDTGTSLAYVVTALCVGGVGVALFSSPNTNAIMSSVPKEDYSVANSIVSTMRTYGQSSGMAILGIVTSVTLGKMTLEEAGGEQLVSMMHAAYSVFACICVVGIVFSLLRDK